MNGHCRALGRERRKKEEVRVSAIVADPWNTPMDPGICRGSAMKQVYEPRTLPWAGMTQAFGLMRSMRHEQTQGPYGSGASMRKDAERAIAQRYPSSLFAD